MLKVLLIDEHPIVAVGLAQLLNDHGMRLIGQISEASRISPFVTQQRPDFIISESRIGGNDLLNDLADLLNLKSAPQVVIYSAFDDLSHIARAAAIGVYEYLLKTGDTGELVRTLIAASEGKPCDEQGLISTSRGRLRRPKQQMRDDVPLTHREFEVLQHVAMGLSNREIGTALGISIETAKEHVQNILRKLDVNDRTQAAVWAVRKELA